VPRGYKRRTCKLEDYIPFQRGKPKPHQGFQFNKKPKDIYDADMVLGLPKRKKI